MRTLIRAFAIVVLVVLTNLVTDGFKDSVIAGDTLDCVATDMNGDGSVGVADAIYFLNWMFTDGPDPEACAQEKPELVYVSVGVDGEQDIDDGDAVVWDVEYSDDNDLHDEDDEAVLLSAGTWMVTCDIGGNWTAFEMMLGDELYKTFYGGGPAQFSALVSVTEDTELTFVMLSETSLTRTLYGDGAVPIFTKFETFKRCNLWAVRLSE